MEKSLFLFKFDTIEDIISSKTSSKWGDVINIAVT